MHRRIPSRSGLVPFCIKFVHIGAFVLQHVNLPLHQRIVIWISGFARALGHCAVSGRLLPGVGIPMLSVTLRIAGDIAVRYACHYTPVMEMFRICPWISAFGV